jgi:hypothetical protein
LLECIGLKGLRPARRGLFRKLEPEGFTHVVKKLLLVVVLGLSAFAVWRKVQADRAELNLWTEATTADD